MSSDPIDIRTMGQAGAARAAGAATRRTARHHFEQLVAEWPRRRFCLDRARSGMSSARRTKNADARSAQTRHSRSSHAILRALIMKGDHLAAKGNARAAVSFYEVVLALSVPKRGPATSDC